MKRIGAFIYFKKPIGKGKYGTVYKGYHVRSKYPVAIKITNHIRKALKEAKLLKQLNQGKYFPRLQSFHIARGKAYIIMDLIKGNPLGKKKGWKWVGKKYNIKKAAKITIKLTKALNYMHAKGIVHNDLKPPNIMFDRRRMRVKIIDFGNARHIRSQRRRTRDLSRSVYVLVFLVKGSVKYNTLYRKNKYPYVKIGSRPLMSVVRKGLYRSKKKPLSKRSYTNKGTCPLCKIMKKSLIDYVFCDISR